jgi:DNA mismatch repair protein MSH5
VAVNQFILPFILEIRPPAEFNTEVAKSRIISLDLAADNGPRFDFVTPGDVYGPEAKNDHGEAIGQQERLLRFAGYIDLDNGSSVGTDGSALI